MKTLQIKDELHIRFKTVATAEGLPLIKATEEAIEDWVEKFLGSLEAVCARNRRDYETLAEMTGQTIAEVEADTCTPDLREEKGIT